jgi:hypothetical protein
VRSWPTAGLADRRAAGGLLDGRVEAGGADRAAKKVGGVAAEVVVDPAPTAAAFDQARLPQYPEVVGEEVGGDRHGGADVAHAAAGVSERGQDA